MKYKDDILQCLDLKTNNNACLKQQIQRQTLSYGENAPNSYFVEQHKILQGVLKKIYESIIEFT